jgi:hypothetical protein
MIIRLRFLILLVLLTCAHTSESKILGVSPNEKNESIFHCAMEPNLSELYFHANQVKDSNLALEIFNEIESIRPNCIDVQISKMLHYGLLEDNQNFYLTDLKVKELKQREKLIYGGKPSNSQFFPLQKSSEIPKGHPPKKDKINYWKWLYIYSQLNRTDKKNRK